MYTRPFLIPLFAEGPGHEANRIFKKNHVILFSGGLCYNAGAWGIISDECSYWKWPTAVCVIVLLHVHVGMCMITKLKFLKFTKIYSLCTLSIFLLYTLYIPVCY